ncbi:MAG TPA: ribonuclease J [Thermohalobaculum sp.]|nr:ribonuclease J [Thermohalobaculum sp.]
MTNKSGGPLVYVALGGAGEIGMNCYLYGLGDAKSRRWIMVDLGIGFGDMETAPGVELILPDLDFILGEKGKLEAIFLTHGHEDHVGAIPHLWKNLGVPIYARAFTTEVVRNKLIEAGMDPKIVRQVGLRERVQAGDFSVEWLAVTHSVPEGSMLAIRTPVGTVVHTGDFKMDPAPQIGEPFDIAPLEALGAEGVLALTCDSTNVFLPGKAGSEAEIIANIRAQIEAAPRAVAATTFASNVARLRTLAMAARDSGRSVVVAGRAMRRMIEMAVKTGQITDFPATVPEDRMSEIPAKKLFYLVTGSQGEGRAALARIAHGTHPTIKLKTGDTVLYSSKTIPGNESGVARVYNQLSEQGVRVIDGDMERIHVSGHARRDDLERVYQAVKPKVAVPMHGEHRHLVEHARMAKEWGAATSIVAPNGTMVRLDGEKPGITEHVETGRIYLDGRVQVGAMDGVIRERLKLARNGQVVVAVVVDMDGDLIADPEVRCPGAPQKGVGWKGTLDELIAKAVDDALEGAPKKAKRTDEGLEEIISRTSRGVAVRHWGKKPVMTILITRLED